MEATIRDGAQHVETANYEDRNNCYFDACGPLRLQLQEIC